MNRFLEIFLSSEETKCKTRFNRNLFAFLSEFVYESRFTKEVLRGKQLYILKLQEKSQNQCSLVFQRSHFRKIVTLRKLLNILKCITFRVINF